MPNASSIAGSLPKDKEFFDIELDKSGEVFVINDLGEIYEFKDQTLLQIHTYDRTKTVLGLSTSDKKDVVIRYDDGTEDDLQTKSKLTYYLGYEGHLDNNKLKFTSDKKNIVVDYNFEPVGTYPLVETTNGDTLILENEALIGDGAYVETRVGKYDKKGALVQTALALPTKEEYQVKVPNKYIYADQNGSVYQMVLKLDSVDVYKLIFSSGKKTNINQNLVDKIKPKPLADKNKEKVAVLTATRSEAVSRARQLWSLVWYYDSSTMKTPSTSTTTPPQHLANASSDYFVGIPYKWGGMNGFDTGTSGAYMNYTLAIQAGKTAGDINDSTVVSSTAGVDCSGFISAAYNFGTKYGTSNLSTVFKSTTWGALAEGDIANKSGIHVWMFIGYNTNSYGEKTGVYTYEATTDGSEDCAKYNNRAWADAQTYTPMTLR